MKLQVQMSILFQCLNSHYLPQYHRQICLKEKPVRMLINDDHMATCWMNVKKSVEDGSITEEGGVPCV
jgi:hypothetical protein